MKKIMAMFLTAVMVLSLAACGSSSSGKTNQASAPAKETSTAEASAAESAAPEAEAAETEAPAAPEAEPAETEAPAPADDGKVYTFKLDCVDPSTSIFAQQLDKWKAEVEEKSGGRIVINIFYGSTLGALPDAYDNLLMGTSDIAWGACPHYPGRFPCAEGLTMPFLGIENNMEGTKVLWDLLENNADFQKEFSKVHVLALHSSAGFVLGSKSLDPATIDSWSGLTIRTSSTGLTKWVESIGGTPISLNAGEVYEAVSKGVVDALFWDWTGFFNYNLQEQISYAVDHEVAFTPFFLLMNQQSYDSLPDDLKQVIDECSGRDRSMTIAEVTYEYAQDCKKQFEEQGVEIITLPDDVLDTWHKAAEPVGDAWAADLDSAGYDGQAMLAAFKEAAAD